VVKATTGGLTDTTVAGATTSSFAVTFKSAGTGGGGGKGNSKGDIQIIQFDNEQSALPVLAFVQSTPPVPVAFVEFKNADSTSSNPSYPAWMVGGPAGTEAGPMDNEFNDFGAVLAPSVAFSVTPAPSPSAVVVEPGTSRDIVVIDSAAQAPHADDVASAPRAPIVNEPETSIGFATKAVSKVFWLAGAALFFTHAAMCTKSRSDRAKEKELEQLANR
jgi:hypothetical protein